MGFPSPAVDYIEPRLTLNSMLMPHPANMMLLETQEGFVLVDRTLTAKNGEAVAFQLGDYPQVGKLFSTGIITSDGETIDGEGMDGIIVLGKVTAEIRSVYEPSRPTL
ncbi:MULTISPECIES: phage repressor protein [unclassified Pantoea]|uniref:LexA family protein n=1 Tax=unclassified Pantoea TaxID=2630326 RepID=UPI0023DB830E|nr:MULTISPECIES: phage repressor protein [unclassified Pantoea]MDF2040803.1 phage repressor protein [Pantoea sp. Cr_R14]MDF2071210.1 phage repressor protein [Pantoea sp. Cr_R13]MDF2080339.1 phage repressor protein [Pantoea sp. Cr_R21]